MSAATGLVRVRWLPATLVMLVLASVGYCLDAQQQMYTDGSHFFLKILEERWFVYGVDFPRHHAHYFTEAPMVLLLRVFDVRSLRLLSWAFGVGLYLPQLVSMATCYWVVRRVNLNYMLFPLLGQFGVSANHSLIMAHEMQVATALFWPLLLVLLVEEEFDWWRVVIVLPLAGLFIRTYEVVALEGTILVGVLAIRLALRWKGTSLRTKVALLAMGAILVFGIAIAVRFTIHPLHPDNRGDFFTSISRIGHHPQAVMSMAFIAAVVLLLLLPEGAGATFYFLALVGLVPLAIGVALCPALDPQLMRPSLHHMARGYMALMPSLLACPAFLVVRRWVQVTDGAWSRIWRLLVLLVVAQTTWQVLAAAQWRGFRSVFEEELSAHRGATPIEDTLLSREQIGIQVLHPFIWPWTNPTLSILWATDHDVRSVVLNPQNYQGGWQPFDPADVSKLPKLERYGVSYTEYPGGEAR